MMCDNDMHALHLLVSLGTPLPYLSSYRCRSERLVLMK